LINKKIHQKNYDGLN